MKTPLNDKWNSSTSLAEVWALEMESYHQCLTGNSAHTPIINGVLTGFGEPSDMQQSSGTQTTTQESWMVERPGSLLSTPILTMPSSMPSTWGLYKSLPKEPSASLLTKLNGKTENPFYFHGTQKPKDFTTYMEFPDLGSYLEEESGQVKTPKERIGRSLNEIYSNTEKKMGAKERKEEWERLQKQAKELQDLQILGIELDGNFPLGQGHGKPGKGTKDTQGPDSGSTNTQGTTGKKSQESSQTATGKSSMELPVTLQSLEDWYVQYHQQGAPQRTVSVTESTVTLETEVSNET